MYKLCVVQIRFAPDHSAKMPRQRLGDDVGRTLAGGLSLGLHQFPQSWIHTK